MLHVSKIASFSASPRTAGGCLLSSVSSISKRTIPWDTSPQNTTCIRITEKLFKIQISQLHHRQIQFRASRVASGICRFYREELSSSLLVTGCRTGLAIVGQGGKRACWKDATCRVGSTERRGHHRPALPPACDSQVIKYSKSCL